MSATIREKSDRLIKILSEAGSAAIALSGGTDSCFLTSVAAGIKGLRFIAITISTPHMFSSEMRAATAFCKKHGVKHKVITMPIPVAVTGNPPDRCYLCKKEIIKAIINAAEKDRLNYIFDGTNADDIADYRPGIKALKEMGIRSPLLEAGLTKEDIRVLAREAGLEMSDKPSNTCLLTRFPHDTTIEPGDLRRAEKAEMLITSMGFEGSRLRIHGDVARIELRKEHFPAIIDEKTRKKLASEIKRLGYRYITVDLEGYRSGSMNKKTEE